jgi:redox-sensitive bicupin YhaK (pirin superfamily)
MTDAVFPDTVGNMVEGPKLDSYAARLADVGSLKIVRALPRRQRRMVGPWCFLDRYGPLSFTGEKAMDVASHPHIGLQTVSWLLDGEVIHNDSLGCASLIRPGQLNLMTAGRGIAHSEETPQENSGKLNGLQLWVALPDEHQHTTPAFDHYPVLPRLEFPGGEVVLILGELNGECSPARTFSPIVGAEIRIRKGGEVTFPVQLGFEHAFFVLDGDAWFETQPLGHEMLHYIGDTRDEVSLRASEGARVLMIGGEAFDRPVLMWWNFVARTHEEMVQAREDWAQHRRFGEVKAYRGPRLSAPELQLTLNR